MPRSHRHGVEDHHEVADQSWSQSLGLRTAAGISFSVAVPAGVLPPGSILRSPTPSRLSPAAPAPADVLSSRVDRWASIDERADGECSLRFSAESLDWAARTRLRGGQRRLHPPRAARVSALNSRG